MRILAFCLAFLCSSTDLVSMDNQQKEKPQKQQPRPDQIHIARKLVRSVRCLEKRKQELESIKKEELSSCEQEQLRHVCISLECQAESLKWVRDTYEVPSLTSEAEEELDALEIRAAQIDEELWALQNSDDFKDFVTLSQMQTDLDALYKRIDALYKN